jgi:hypothetical protein
MEPGSFWAFFERKQGETPKNCYGKKPQEVFVVLWPPRNA